MTILGFLLFLPHPPPFLDYPLSNWAHQHLLKVVENDSLFLTPLPGNSQQDFQGSSSIICYLFIYLISYSFLLTNQSKGDIVTALLRLKSRAQESERELLEDSETLLLFAIYFHTREASSKFNSLISESLKIQTKISILLLILQPPLPFNELIYHLQVSKTSAFSRKYLRRIFFMSANSPILWLPSLRSGAGIQRETHYLSLGFSASFKARSFKRMAWM